MVVYSRGLHSSYGAIASIVALLVLPTVCSADGRLFGFTAGHTEAGGVTVSNYTFKASGGAVKVSGAATVCCLHAVRACDGTHVTRRAASSTASLPRVLLLVASISKRRPRPRDAIDAFGVADDTWHACVLK